MPPDARLGKACHRTVLTPLDLVRREGGMVPRTLVLLQRAYPVTYHSHGQAGPMTPKAHTSLLRGLESRAAKVRYLAPQTWGLVFGQG